MLGRLQARERQHLDWLGQVNLRDRITYDGKDYEVSYISTVDKPLVISARPVPTSFYVNAEGPLRVGDIYSVPDFITRQPTYLAVLQLERVLKLDSGALVTPSSGHARTLLVRDGKRW